MLKVLKRIERPAVHDNYEKNMSDNTFESTIHEGQLSEGAIRLTHAALMTRNLEQAIQFYVDVLGLKLSVEGEDPIREGHQRAMLVDATGVHVIELIEYPELRHASVPGHGAVNHIGFRLPKRSWHTLRSKLDSLGYPYQEIENRLFVRDADAVVLEIEKS